MKVELTSGWLAEALQCPKCRLALSATDRCSGCGSSFPTSAGKPVLIDFEQSIFTPKDCQRPADEEQQGSAIGRAILRITYGRNRSAERTVAKFISLAGSKSRVLVIGGGSVGEGMAPLYAGTDLEVVGTDVFPSAQTILLCDGHSLPFRDGSFDGVVIQAVLEHVLDPHRVVEEIHRVLRADGLLLAETPFMQQVHLGAYDFTRFTLSGHRWLFRRFEQIEAGVSLGPGIAFVWSVAQMLRSIGLGSRATALLTLPFAWIRLLDRFVGRAAAADGASGVYFLGRKSAKALHPRDMVDYYHANR